jgi:predicted metal-binding protein
VTLLRPAAPGPSVVACNSCRSSADAREDAEGVRGGARLALALRAVQAADPRYAGIAVEEMPCLFACTEHCTVHLRAPGKVGYVLGRFAPDAEAARAILDYALAHAESAEGSVPYRQWPEGVKGHFIVRVPPEGAVVA